MGTRILMPSEISIAADLLRRGQLVAFPTETVYGLGACAFDPEAIAQIFCVKGRPQDNPLIVHIQELEEVKSVAREVPGLFYTLAQHFWPGPLTVVLKRSPRLPSIVSAGLDSVAVRLPSHPLAKELIHQVGEPLVAPSANLSGRPSPTCAQHVKEDLNGKIAAILDGGQAEWGLESTVVSLLDSEPRLLRPGVISKEALEEVLGEFVGYYQAGDPAHSPGMKYRHYSPLCPVKLVDSLQVKEVRDARKRLVLFSSDAALHSIPGARSEVVSGANVYALLRLADQEEYEEVIVCSDASLQSQTALMNRLRKAAGQIDS